MTDVDRFWDRVAECGGDRERLRKSALGWSTDELLRFHVCFAELSAWLLDDEFERRLPGASEDHLEDVAWWIVGRGRDLYDRVVDDPATIAGLRPDTGEILYGVVEDVHRERTGASAVDAGFDLCLDPATGTVVPTSARG